MIKANIIDLSTDISAKVTPRGELVVGALAFSTAYNATASVIDTGYNLIPARNGDCFIITSILIYANKAVGANDATVVIYTANSPTSISVVSTLLTTEIKSSTSRDFVGLNLFVPPGYWVNAKTDDNTVFFTIMGYYTQNSDDAV